MKSDIHGNLCDRIVGISQHHRTPVQTIPHQIFIRRTLDIGPKTPLTFRGADIGGSCNIFQRNIFSIILMNKRKQCSNPFMTSHIFAAPRRHIFQSIRPFFRHFSFLFRDIRKLFKKCQPDLYQLYRYPILQIVCMCRFVKIYPVQFPNCFQYICASFILFPHCKMGKKG